MIFRKDKHYSGVFADMTTILFWICLVISFLYVFWKCKDEFLGIIKIAKAKMNGANPDELRKMYDELDKVSKKKLDVSFLGRKTKKKAGLSSKADFRRQAELEWEAKYGQKEREMGDESMSKM